MLPEQPDLPRRWFVGAAGAALVLTAIVTLFLLRPTTEIAKKPPAPAEQTAPNRPPTAGDARPAPTCRKLNLPRQATGEGTIIPWGGVAASTAVRLQIIVAEPECYAGAELYLSRNGAAAEKFDRSDYNFDFSQLQPGRYRWHAVLRGKDAPMTVEPPRSATAKADFTIPPPVLALSRLGQTQLDGSPIGRELLTESGALVSAVIDYPQADLEVEMKPAGRPFDGSGILSARADDDGFAQLEFRGDDGSYRWRARARAQTRQTPWQEFRYSPTRDFIVFHANRPEPQGRPPGDTLVGSPSMSLSSAGGGQNQPNPSSVPDLPPLWSLMMSNTLLNLAIACIFLSALLLGFRFWQSRRSRKT